MLTFSSKFLARNKGLTQFSNLHSVYPSLPIIETITFRITGTISINWIFHWNILSYLAFLRHDLPKISVYVTNMKECLQYLLHTVARGSFTPQHREGKIQKNTACTSLACTINELRPKLLLIPGLASDWRTLGIILFVFFKLVSTYS